MIKSTTLLITLFTAIIASNAQNYQWAKRIGGSSSDNANSITVDNSGNVYTTGSFRGTVDFDPGIATSNLTSTGFREDIFISKLDSAGNFQWAKSIGGSFFDIGYSIAVDSYGNTYTTGYFEGTVDFDPGIGISNLTSAGNRDIFILKLDAAGNFIWAKKIGGTDSESSRSILVDSFGNVYTTGSFRGTADFDPGIGTSNLVSTPGNSDNFISKLDSAGNFIWAKSMGGSSNNYGYSIAIDGSGNVYTTGIFYGTVDFDPGAGTTNLTSAGIDDIFISKLDNAGNFIWAKTIGGISSDGGTSIAVDNSGNVYTTGFFQDTVDFDPGVGTSNLITMGNGSIFITKLDTTGNFIWAKKLGGMNRAAGFSIALDCFDNVYTTGYFEGTADFDPGVGTNNLISAGSEDIFISKLDAAGNFIWAIRKGGPSIDWSYSIAVDCSGNVFSSGFFTSTADFDPGPGTSNLTSLGDRDIFISKLGPINVGITESSFENTLSVYPNPFKVAINIDMGKSYEGVIVIIRNSIGQEVLNESHSGSNLLEVNIPGEAGLYFIEVISNDRKAILKVIKN